MAGETSNLTVFISPVARCTLDEIWDWNADPYGVEHADEYIAFLLAETRKLSGAYFQGKRVPSLPKLSYVVLKRSHKGHGHVAIYELIHGVIKVLDYFHTAQDWQTKLLERQ